MAGRKKQEIQLQREIETQEEWEEVMAMEGLWVIDVFQEWCGPCQALVGNFRRLKNELGDPLLHYAIAKADTIDGLEKYRGRCEPTFLFFAGGILVSFIHGANAPKLQRVITEQLAQEHKVLDGTGERKEVQDTFITRLEEKAQEKAEAEEAAREAEDGDGSYSSRQLPEGVGEVEVAKGVTVAIIKPDAVAQGKADEIVEEMKAKGIEIIAQEERELTEEEATELYSELKDEDYFNDLIKFITSGPSHLLVLTHGTTGDTVVKDWREMIGPTQVEAAKDEAPDSMRAKYGDSGYMNALHGSSSSESAARELAFFFPNLAVPTYKKKKLNIQRTLALIRPEAFNTKKDEVLAKITEAGFKIAMYKEVQLSKEQAADFYKEHEGQNYFDQLVEHMTSGPVLALGLAGDEAISGWREMLGPPNVDEATETSPESLRATYTGPSGINQFHGSDSEVAAKKELNFFFPMEETVAVIKPSAMGTKDAIINRIHEAGFRIAARKETTITKDIAEMLYPNHSDKDYYEDLVESMTSGPTMFMVLSREDAVEGWRQEIGETNPEDAKVTNPESIRAQYGSDLLNNAVHGSSTQERAKEEMKAVFGDLEFNDDGTVKGEEPELDEATEALQKGRSTPVAETAPEYRNQEGHDETADQTTDADQTTQDADTTQDVTADTTQADQTQEPTEMETTQADTTVAETAEDNTTTQEQTTAGDETQAETEADTTQADTTQADTTQADTTQAETTEADTTQAETTEADTTQAETTEAGTTEAKTTEPATTEPPKEASATDNQTAAETEGVGEQSTNLEESPPAEDQKAEETKTDTQGEEQSPQTEEPASQTQQAEEQAPEKPAEEQTTEKPTEEQAAEKPSEEQAAEKPAEEQAAEKPTEEQAAEKPAEEQAAEKPTEEQAAEKPAEEQATEKPAEEQVAEKPAEEQAAEEQAQESKAAEEKPASPSEQSPQETKTSESLAQEQEAAADAGVKGGDDDAQSAKGQEVKGEEDKKDDTTAAAAGDSPAEVPSVAS